MTSIRWLLTGGLLLAYGLVRELLGDRELGALLQILGILLLLVQLDPRDR